MESCDLMIENDSDEVKNTFFEEPSLKMRASAKDTEFNFMSLEIK